MVVLDYIYYRNMKKMITMINNDDHLSKKAEYDDCGDHHHHAIMIMISIIITIMITIMPNREEDSYNRPSYPSPSSDEGRKRLNVHFPEVIISTM